MVGGMSVYLKAAVSSGGQKQWMDLSHTESKSAKDNYQGVGIPSLQPSHNSKVTYSYSNGMPGTP